MYLSFPSQLKHIGKALRWVACTVHSVTVILKMFEVFIPYYVGDCVDVPRRTLRWNSIEKSRRSRKLSCLPLDIPIYFNTLRHLSWWACFVLWKSGRPSNFRLSWYAFSWKHQQYLLCLILPSYSTLSNVCAVMLLFMFFFCRGLTPSCLMRNCHSGSSAPVVELWQSSSVKTHHYTNWRSAAPSSAPFATSLKWPYRWDWCLNDL